MILKENLKTILAVDPGYSRLGYAVIKTNGREKKFIEAGLIETDAKTDWQERVLKIGKELEKNFVKHKPDIFIVESIFFSANQKTALKVAEIKGIATYIAAKNGVPTEEISPREMKLAFSGYGLADKRQLEKIVKLELKVPESVKIDDVFDALALAIIGALKSAKKYPQF